MRDIHSRPRQIKVFYEQVDIGSKETERRINTAFDILFAKLEKFLKKKEKPDQGQSLFPFNQRGHRRGSLNGILEGIEGLK